MELTTLYRPVGPDELVLIEQSGWKRFPPRRPDHSSFTAALHWVVRG